MNIKQAIVSFLLLALVSSCEKPSQFSQLALNDTLESLEGKNIQFKEIINQYKGKKVVIDVWASWCSDCIKSLPDVIKFQEANPKIVFLYLSIDRNTNAWKKAISKYNIKGEHYYMNNGIDSDFGDFLNSNWTPRYMVLDEQSNIALFKATKISDKRIKKLLQ